MDDVQVYLREVARVPVLNPAQVNALFQELEYAGPQADHARKRLIEVHLRLAVSVARKYVGRGLPLIDLLVASNRGLIRAVERFDHRKGVRFSTYAIWWMRRAIIHALQAHAAPS